MNGKIPKTSLYILLLLSIAFSVSGEVEQAVLPRVESMPDLPSPLAIRDWKTVGRGYIAFVLDDDKSGEHLPVVEYDALPNGMFVLPSYVAHGEKKTEAINAMALVVSGTLLGVDMRNDRGRDILQSVVDYYYCEREGLCGNDRSGCGVTEFWYKILPNILYYQIADLYSDDAILKTRILRMADQLYEASIAMGGSLDQMIAPDYEHWSFDFDAMQPRDDRHWRGARRGGCFRLDGLYGLHPKRR